MNLASTHSLKKDLISKRIIHLFKGTLFLFKNAESSTVLVEDEINQVPE
jgi:hypothetical protein